MKMLFYIGLLGLGIFEVMNVYFIMPMPGSQRMNSIDVAYFLYSYRWIFRIAFGLMIVLGARSAFSVTWKWKWLPALLALPVLYIVYTFNFSMTADHMFLQPQTLTFKSQTENTLNDSSVVVAVNFAGEAKAYPIRYILYHHQVRDTVGGKPIMVTYCNVCRTGRVFEPLVNGTPENFRLVGMDHFNAMFEDMTTKSWWRQATGEAITGPLKGTALPEYESNQFTLARFFSVHPSGKVMQPEYTSRKRYDSLGRFEKGKSKGPLTRPDTISWKDKSWVVGIQLDGKAKAYDWIEFKKTGIVHDKVGDTPIVLALASDQASFIAFERQEDQQFVIRNDSLINGTTRYDFAGRGDSGEKLKSVITYQEFWHSWKQFHPNTEAYNAN